LPNYQVRDAYGSVITIESSTIGSAERQIISGTLTLSGNQSVSGTVGASVIGLTPVTFSGSPSISGAVTVIGNPSISGTVNIGTIPGSVIGFQGGTWSPSAIGYLKRNDALASTLGADLTYGQATRDSAGRTVIKPYVADDGTIIEYTGSVVSTSVTLIRGSAIGLRNYITDFFAVNTGAANTLITFTDGSTSVLGYTIAPTVSGSNAPGIAIPFKTAPSQDLRFQAGTGTSILYMTVRGYQAP